ncbi:hypothetical protein [Belliella aquatica]|uniref:Uncharacterized protein n=1 Tax=Belliella aquatica TaxID=1323734 RepID=A0ABQ1LZ55_9BACT|nr:hypothetical protein [Belliella aquatica]MCH7406891.1 hypothetical protein [Belliella aquatica]GGC31935.1 hypothetical protein GCM10010993_08610 [Belliella aquatica]
MKKISRKTFIKQSASLGLLTTMIPFSSNVWAADSKLSRKDSKIVERLIKANDDLTTQLILPENSNPKSYIRQQGYDFAVLSASYCHPQSSFFKSKKVLQRMESLILFLLSQQRSDGTMNTGNLESPPDTAFVMEPLCAAAKILIDHDHQDISKVNSDLKKFILSAGEALVYGGIHTPNHRWVLSAALAKINHVYPDNRYVNRVNDWLGEGVFIDEDGHYPERSMNYSAVENEAFITMAKLLDKEELLTPVRKNMEMTYYYMETNGDLITFDSRRQDQYSHHNIVSQYLNYRYLAIKDKSPFFAGIAREIQGFEGFEQQIIRGGLYYFMEHEILQEEMPTSAPLPRDYTKIFPTSSLARIRREDTTMTIFGGVDWPLIIASGRSISPNFFSFRKGQAVLKHIRMSSAFFSMGHFRSEGLDVENGKYILYKKLQAPYYQPLPQELRNSEGDYELSASVDGRFWSKMSFADRPVSNVKTLESKITIEENNGKADLSIEVTGLEGVPVTVELCFGEGGEFTGLSAPVDSQGNRFLEEGLGSYKMGRDEISFGPGIKKHESIYRLDGEMYTVHFGTLRTKGDHVYLTGITPFNHTITIK